MLQPYREVLTRPGAAAFSAAGALARLPMSMVGIGIVLMVSTVYGSYGLAGQVAAVYVTVHAVCSPQLARLVDRHGQGRVMRPAVLVAAAGLASMALVGALAGPVLLLVTAAAVAGASIGSVGALVRARWSHVLRDPRQLHTAYSLESAVDELVFVVGPVLATVLATSVHPTAGLVVPVVAVVAGGLLLFGQRGTEPPTSQRVRGVRRTPVLRHPGMVVVAVVFVAMGAIFGATDVATVAFAEEQGRKAAAGAILAVFAAGSLVSGLGYGARHWLSPLWLRFVLGMLGLAAGVSLFLVVRSLPALAAVMFVTGFAIAPTLINGNGLVQQFVARDRLTEGLTWVGTSLGVGVAAGSSVAGVAIDRQGSHGGFLVVTGAAAFAAVATLAGFRTLRRGHVEESREGAVEEAAVDDDVTDGGHDGTDEGRAPAPSGGPTDRPEHLVVMGVSGAGKSTVGHLLAQHLDRPFAEGDEHHPPENLAAMRAGTPLTDEQRAPWLAALRDWMSAHAAEGRSTVVACSALRVHYRDVLRGAEGRVRFVHLVGGEELVARRQAARTGHFMPASLMGSQVATLEPLREDEDGVTVPVETDPDGVVGLVLGALDEQRTTR